MAKQMDYVSPGGGPVDKKKKKKRSFIDEEVGKIRKADRDSIKSKQAKKSAIVKDMIGKSLTGTMGKSATAVRAKKNKEIEAAIEREMKKKKK